MKQLIAFDLDGTLAESKQPIGEEMAGLLARLLDVAKVGVISGGDWPQFEIQVVARLPGAADLARLFIMPTTGTKLYRFQDGSWRQIYADSFDAAERDRIMRALDQAATQAGLVETQTWGEKIEDRGTQITFSGLGQQAPLAAKAAWDPDFTKRKRLQALLRAMLPGLSINTGGSTSIDITRSGVDKAYAMRKLSEHSGVPADAMLFLGDAIYPGGNDEPVRAAGFDTIAVRDVRETGNVVRAIIGCLTA
ncbi:MULTISPECIES: HAD-IIB family hydrolase [Sphingomonadaceae]|uniref:HAD-IIB family hydrolase n=1 Tax=Sphingomonadales TaxID=204457 RepID=UPI00076FE6B7|nr:HAD-IIB family hydrolase [Sphingobium sp. TKS]AMK22958.1 phosphomannomutase [Sphingobium sp. TKS]MCF8706697.1 HAD-IIB family hydrolase [Rhizorhapis sp. SPR117]